MSRTFFLILATLLTLPAYAQLLIAPTRFVLDADRSITEKIVVENTSDKPIRLEIKPTYRPIALKEVNRLNASVEQTENIADWLQVSPPVIRELKPNQRRTIRLRFNALPQDKEQGEYRAYLHFSPIALGEQATDAKQQSQPSFQLDFRVNSYVPIYVQRGAVKDEVVYQCDNHALRVTNNGKYQFNALINADGQESKLVLLRESEMIKPLPGVKKVSLLQDDKSLHECVF
tara:strand:+ start:1849 stop:2541 length:693 start_codon:yes stop_codon:yes gene_type:complete